MEPEGRGGGRLESTYRMLYTLHHTTRYQLVLRSRRTMTALRTIVGACNRYVKALKKRLAGKRDDRRRRRKVGATPVDDQVLQSHNFYDNEAVDNMINEFIDNKKASSVGQQK